MLSERKLAIAEERSTRDPLTQAEVKALLGSVDEVVLVRGRSVQRHPARRIRPADLKGPTGGFRAPMLRRGRTLLVGFNVESLTALVR